MKSLPLPITLTLSAVAGILLGYTGGPVYVLVIWAVAGIGIGLASPSRHAALIGGFVFGFLVSYTFMLAGYSGKDPLTAKLIPFIVFGLFGALCGLILGWIGNKVKPAVKRPTA